jgi:DNA-binding MarR family transcriptional regulator
MSAETGASADLGEAEQAVLEALDADDPTGSRRADLANAVAVDYPTAEFALKQRGLIEEAGIARVNTDEGTVKHRLVALTERGETALADVQAPEPDPDPVDPEVVPDRPSPWNETTDWDTLSESVDRLLDETVAAEPDASAECVRLTLEHDGERADLDVSLVAWHNTGRTAFFDEYTAAFGEPPGIDEREWGVYQARLIDRQSDGS